MIVQLKPSTSWSSTCDPPRASIAARASAINDEIARLSEMGLRSIEPIRQTMIIRRIVRVAGVDEASIRQAIGAQRLRTGAPASSEMGQIEGEMPFGPTKRRRRWEPGEFAFGCLLVEPKILEESPKEVRDILDGRAYCSSPLRAAVDSFAVMYEAEGRAPSVNRLVSESPDADTKSELASLVAEIERITRGDAEAVVANWEDAYRRARLAWASKDAPAAAPESESGASDLDAIRAMIESKRAQHQEFGGNPMAMPRPAG